jgi:peptidoglycan/LPS O-acetylase OafA/YrhL
MPWQWIYDLLDFGHWSVAVFIVLSGYCLMLPVVRAQHLHIPGGVQSYLWRRTRRIMPPYYAAPILTLLLILAVPMLQHPGADRWSMALPAFDAGVMLSHFFMIHIFSPDWIWKINSPMWSVAVEWWIYFLFPWLLLPLWRRLGIMVGHPKTPVKAAVSAAIEPAP